ncbi:3,4-dihydroxy-2-butanone-4-phosphate synthase [Pseudonocardia sp. WMMC193]|uniref:3,4-dihydroxy-2-butanone-4-phosphate synthase n=1 Tax=Pseudonocardia sp. WMMC193 TaxID=2911965 RepID=UPI001F2D7A15|nr:3,4-dihydroxy-2-butanone-4-phosphate synthase [Pseudonocardia sp. WMMC193]MCF7548046.1 3,4-dihydroxy-2-butanone-4-phosphate synthase [Pseudonocardia sp. WMMC193]
MTAALRADRAASSPIVEALFDGRPILVLGPAKGGVPMVGSAGSACVLLAAATATTEGVAWAVRHSTGLLRAVVEPERADALRLPPMSGVDRARRGNLQTASVDGVGTGTGISAASRARTLRMLADPATGPDDLVVPGHVLVELAGTEVRPTPAGAVAEAAVRLCARAGLPPVAVLADVLDAAGEPLGPAGLRALADATSVPLLTVPVPVPERNLP